MRHDYQQFLRRGGHGEIVLTATRCGVVAHGTKLRLKSTFPNYAALRHAFSDRLVQVINETAERLLHDLNPPDTVPFATEADLPDLSPIHDEGLHQWDLRLEAIYAEYHSHPARLRPLRMAMEERLLRGIAGGTNMALQHSLGVTHYVWRSQGDERVRDAHAARNGQVFRWADTPEGGHPGQDHNCRCWAEPLTQPAGADLIFIDAPTADLPFENQIGLQPITPSGVAAAGLLATAGGSTLIRRLLDQTYLTRGARVLGADDTTVEGFIGSWAYGTVRRRITDGRPFDTLNYPKTSGDAEILAQAAGLFAMMHPDVAIRALSRPSDPGDFASLDAFLRRSHEAYLAGRLSLNDGSLASGWIETFPELSEDERRLGEVPGFTDARIEAWLETYAPEELGHPNHTGSPVPTDPTGTTVSTPITDETGPNIVSMKNPHSIDSVSIPQDRARHILDGEGRRGGHRFGTGTPGKTEFPETWSDDDILNAIKEVAGTGTVDRAAHREGDLVIVGEVNGVIIEVVVTPNGEVRTGYPLSGEGVRRN